jgi:hypothetical protein
MAVSAVLFSNFLGAQGLLCVLQIKYPNSGGKICQGSSGTKLVVNIHQVVIGTVAIDRSHPH